MPNKMLEGVVGSGLAYGTGKRKGRRTVKRFGGSNKVLAGVIGKGKGMPGKAMFRDKDRDKVMNVFDCQPRNRRKQGFFHGDRSKLTDEPDVIDDDFTTKSSTNGNGRRFAREEREENKALEQQFKGQELEEERESFLSTRDELSRDVGRESGTRAAFEESGFYEVSNLDNGERVVDKEGKKGRISSAASRLFSLGKGAASFGKETAKEALIIHREREIERIKASGSGKSKSSDKKRGNIFSPRPVAFRKPRGSGFGVLSEGTVVGSRSTSSPQTTGVRGSQPYLIGGIGASNVQLVGSPRRMTTVKRRKGRKKGKRKAPIRAARVSNDLNNFLGIR